MGHRLCLALALATLLGCAASAGGLRRPAGNGVAFNGTSSHAVVKDGAAFDLPAFTLACWAKVPRTDRPQVLLNRGASGTLFTLYLYKAGVRMLVEYEAGKYTHAIAPLPPKNVWTHYTGTYDGKLIRVYMDGVLKTTTPAAGRIARSKARLYLGALNPFERHLEGQLSDVRVWDRALSSAQIAAVVAGTEGDDAPRPLARWMPSSLTQGKWKNLAMDKLHADYLADPKIETRRFDGYRGIWYSNQAQGGPYVYKYSGGLGTYCAKHAPFAVYAKAVNKTFFCYGGTADGANSLVHMVSYFDHATGTVPRPVFLLDKQTTDAHDNPVISLDDKGHVWIFSSSHGTSRPSFISVSKKPYDISDFERVVTTNFSYPQPWHVTGKGFAFVHTLYRNGRCNYFSTSPDGRTWTEPQLLAKIEMGHYQVSREHNGTVGTAFNFHPAPKGLNWRTNLYYMQTRDMGKTWTTVDGRPLTLPLTTPDNPALVHDFRAEKLNVYMKQVAFDHQGHPIILCLTSKGWEAGPDNGPRIWRTARWTGKAWDIQGTIPSDNNYDTGSLYIEQPTLWRIIGPTHTGPQPFNPGGEIAMWTSTDLGRSWTLVKQMTRGSQYNHTYVRRPINAHPDFYGFWADGHGRKPSDSRLYFCDRDGNVFRLPVKMDGDTAKPERVVPAAPDGGKL
ncbi:BNR-4 repeat-containing protein [bacterium]|nr:BNR-4 repeat-containing protein [bacterium]